MIDQRGQIGTQLRRETELADRQKTRARAALATHARDHGWTGEQTLTALRMLGIDEEGDGAT